MKETEKRKQVLTEYLIKTRQKILKTTETTIKPFFFPAVGTGIMYVFGVYYTRYLQCDYLRPSVCLSVCLRGIYQCTCLSGRGRGWQIKFTLSLTKKIKKTHFTFAHHHHRHRPSSGRRWPGRWAPQEIWVEDPWLKVLIYVICLPYDFPVSFSTIEYWHLTLPWQPPPPPLTNTHFHTHTLTISMLKTD